MDNLTRNTEASQGETESPVIKPVLGKIEDLIFDYSNLQHWVSVDACKLEAIAFLKQNPEIAYANQSFAGLELALETLYLTLRGAIGKEQIINSISAIQYVVNKIKGAQ